MTRFAALALIVLAACSSSRSDNELPPTIPPAEVHAPQSGPDPRLNDLQTSLTELLDRLDVLNARIAKLEAAQTTPAPPAPAAVSASPATATPAPRTAVLHQAQIADDYRHAIILVGQSKYADARNVFQHVFDEDPSGDLADNALFWIGETYFATANYQQAMRMYERVAKEYPDQNKAADALFKLGLTYEKTGDLGMARRALNDCIARYPYSSPAAAARMELKKIRY